MPVTPISWPRAVEKRWIHTNCSQVHRPADVLYPQEVFQKPFLHCLILCDSRVGMLMCYKCAQKALQPAEHPAQRSGDLSTRSRALPYTPTQLQPQQPHRLVPTSPTGEQRPFHLPPGRCTDGHQSRALWTHASLSASENQRGYPARKRSRERNVVTGQMPPSSPRGTGQPPQQPCQHNWTCHLTACKM